MSFRKLLLILAGSVLLSGPLAAQVTTPLDSTFWSAFLSTAVSLKV